MSWPVMTTRATCPASAACMNSLNVIVFSAAGISSRNSRSARRGRPAPSRTTDSSTSSSSGASQDLKSQDYHGLRAVCYPKRLVNPEARHPHDPIGAIDDQRHVVALFPRRLSGPRSSPGASSAPSSPTGRNRSPGRRFRTAKLPEAAVESNPNDVPGVRVARDCTGTCLGRDGPAGRRQSDLSWNRQRKSKRVRSGVRRRTSRGPSHPTC